MEGFTDNLAKLTPDKLVNLLLKLGDEHRKSDPADQSSLDLINEKIKAVHEAISTLGKDKGNISKVTDIDKLERSKAGHLGQITVLTNKFESKFDDLSTASEEDDRSELIITLDQIASTLSYQLAQVENKTNKLELLLNEDSLSDLVAKKCFVQ